MPAAVGRQYAARAAVWPGAALRPRARPRHGPAASGRARRARPPERFAETGRGELPDQVRDQAAAEVHAIADAGVAELLLAAHDVAQFCKQHGIPQAARGSATSSLVAWALGLVELCPLDYHLDSQLFVHDGRGDLPTLTWRFPACTSRPSALFRRATAPSDSALVRAHTALCRWSARSAWVSVSASAPVRPCGRSAPPWVLTRSA
ncbi:MAG: hypothetical protein LC797_03550 [Chloroflexi bacterium]|nr:hypothetical protein [Chloroflexota bacterium]